MGTALISRIGTALAALAILLVVMLAGILTPTEAEAQGLGGICAGGTTVTADDGSTFCEIKPHDDTKDCFGGGVETGSYALSIYCYSLQGPSAGSQCIGCDFISYFLAAISQFSIATYDYLFGAVKLLLPVLFAIWIGVRVAKLAMVGGEDGRNVIWSIIQKLALFAMIWLVLGAGGGKEREKYLWELSGPNFIGYAFSLSAGIQTEVVKRAGLKPVDCRKGVSELAVPIFKDLGPAVRSFADGATNIACNIERTHAVGIASGVAMVFAGVAQVDLWNNPASFGTMLVALISGAMLIAVFAMSAIWFTFLILDIIVRFMLTAAFSPVLIGLYLFEVTRSYAGKAFTRLIGAMLTTVSLAIVSVIAMILLTNVTKVYEASRTYQPLLESYGPAPYKFTKLSDEASYKDDFAEFIFRIQNSDDKKARIPMDLSTPWFSYLLLSGLAIFALGKKIITMIEDMVGYPGASAMADNALKTFKTAAFLGTAGAGAGLMAAKAVGGASMGPAAAGANFMTGGLVGAGAAGVGAVANKISAWNPFGNAARGVAGAVTEGAKRGAEMKSPGLVGGAIRSAATAAATGAAGAAANQVNEP